MSVNKYDSTTDTLTTLASGSRIWTGSEAAYKAERSAGTLPTNALIMITDDEVDTCHYSTDETFTGNYWIDGKKIYRKVFEKTYAETTGAWVTIIQATEITSLNIHRMLKCTFYSAVYNGEVNATYTTCDNSNGIKAYFASNGSSGVHYITVEYTKTTD